MASRESRRKHLLLMTGVAFRSAGRPGVIDRAVYGTIVVTSVLVVYDGWANLTRLDAVAIILGPAIAMVIGHIFASSLSDQAALGRRPTRSELLNTVRHESRFVLVAVPQVVLLFVLTLAGLSLHDTVHVLVWAGAASLGYLGRYCSVAGGSGRAGASRSA
jgi:hypothetical protein